MIRRALAFALLFFLAVSCRPAAAAPKLKVITTLFPIYDMARQIGADKADVSLLLPPGVEPHSFEPKFGDIVRINRADIFIYTGPLMEPWAADLLKGITNKNLIVIEAGRGVKIVGRDPHIWMDFDNAKIMVGNIAGAFEAKDEANKKAYEQKATAYEQKLSALDGAFRRGLGQCRVRQIVYGGHYAFGYLARRYGLKYLAAQGLSPDAEPTADDLARLVKQIRQEKIKYIFYEELTSPKIAETIANETGARLLLLNGGHNVTRDQLKNGTTFFDILQADLNNLELGMECKE
jgi:zinc transport system substrate-binding protein